MATLAAGTAAAQPAPPSAPPTTPTTAEFDSRGWRLLGERAVQGRRDRDTIAVGAYEGRFDQIVMVVADGNVQLNRLAVTFGNGERFRPTVRHVFREGTRTRVIDLPGNDRMIRKIDLNYRRFGRGQALVQVWGRDTRAGADPAPTPAPPAGWDSRGWTMLGERPVAGKADLDRIVIGKDDGTFKQITMVVLDSDLVLNDLVVFFGNGQTFNPKIKHTFKEGARTRVIDLPRDRRIIEKVEISYGNLPGTGRARVQIWGK